MVTGRRQAWWWLSALAAVSIGALGLTARADDVAPARPILHEDLPPPHSAAADPSRQPIYGPTPREGQNPSAFADADKILPQPLRDAARDDNEPVLGRGGLAADRDTESRPDRFTGGDDTLHYVTVFNPSVLPFKRMSALDSAHGDYTLYTSSRSRVDLVVGGERRSDRDLFWGSLVVAFRPGVDVPIPSVAPDMRILSYEVEPRVEDITFSKDGADNFFVRSDQSGVSGTFRLVFLADADARYFAGKPPSGYQVEDVARLAPPSLAHALPDRVQQTARRAHRALGIDRHMDLGAALDRLVYYFRAFEAKDPPEDTGDIYWDLFQSQAGVCRHRSFAFMITANALGIPTRYITNEAHAFVEVWVPQAEWMRIDLGGAALRMEVQNAGDKAIYRPRDKDQFAKPPSYTNNYTRLEGDIRGLSNGQLEDARTPIEDDPLTAQPEQNDDEPGNQPPRVGPGRHLPTLPESATAGKTDTSIEVTDTDPIGYRGEEIRVRGRLTGPRGGVAGLRVDIYLAPAGFSGDDAVLCGHTVTADDGSFTAQVPLPRSLEPRDYEIFAATPGDASYGPSVSD